MIFFEGTEAEAAKRFTAFQMQTVVCRWKTDKDRRRHYFRLILWWILVNFVCITLALILYALSVSALSPAN